MAGAVQRKTRFAIVVLVNGRHCAGVQQVQTASDRALIMHHSPTGQNRAFIPECKVSVDGESTQ